MTITLAALVAIIKNVLAKLVQYLGLMISGQYRPGEWINRNW